MTPKAPARTRASTPVRPLAVVMLAAGEGKRFRSQTPKLLHDLCGRPLLAWPLRAVQGLKPQRTVVVIGRGAQRVQAAVTSLTTSPVVFATQIKQRGTGDASRVALDALGEFDGDVLVVFADNPLITTQTLRALAGRHRKTKAKATVLSATVTDPTGYGRIVRVAGGALQRIVEHADATPQQRAIAEINAGVGVYDCAALRAALDKLETRNKQGELYLTDVVGILRDTGEPVDAIAAATVEETIGVNDRAQLAEVAAIIRARVNKDLMANGVTIVDPAQTYVDPDVKIGADTILHPLTFLTGATRIGKAAEIGPGVRAHDSKIGDGARVVFATLDGATVGADATVGPYAYLRPGAVLKRKAKVGTFVEVKGSTIGEGSKVPHLSYVGDATIGKDVNVGAATVTVNYDSETKIKSKTIVGDGAKIGSDTMLIAPVKIGKGAVTGAGSIVTRDVPNDTVVYGNPARPARKRKRTNKAGQSRGHS